MFMKHVSNFNVFSSIISVVLSEDGAIGGQDISVDVTCIDPVQLYNGIEPGASVHIPITGQFSYRESCQLYWLRNLPVELIGITLISGITMSGTQVTQFSKKCCVYKMTPK